MGSPETPQPNVAATRADSRGTPAKPWQLARPWRAWNTFVTALGLAFVAFLVFLGAAVGLRIRHGQLTEAEAQALLGLLYRGTYPLVFLALGALLWHWIQHYRGAYARR